MSNSFSVRFILKKYKAKDGQAPLYIRLTYNGKHSDTSLKRKVTLEKWNHNQRVSGTSMDVKKLNRYLDELYNKTFQIYERMQLNDQYISAEIIKNKLFNLENEENHITLLTASSYHYDQNKNNFSQGTLKHYKVTERYFKRYLESEKKLSDISIKNIDYKFLLDFEAFLRAWQPEDHQQPIGHNSIMKHMCRFRKILNYAYKMDWIADSPFKKYKISYQKSNRTYLTKEELFKLEIKEFDIERLDQIRDLFIFSCYTGLSYIDLYHLSEEDITVGMDGEKWIHFKRQKTATPFSVPLLPKAIEIIEKYHNHPRVRENQLLPVVSNQKTNAYLKEIATICKIKKTLTFHIARHTFATTVTLTNGVPIETVSKMLGHTKLATTQIYAKVVENKIGEDMAALKQKLSASQQLRKAD
jgi:site-specific recombinase XerD